MNDSKQKISGSIFISEIEIKQSNLSESYIFKYLLSKYTKDPCAGWYAKKLENGFWKYLWCEGGTKLPGRYLKALKNDGWEISYTILADD
jgi:hypothetical protein